MFDLIPSRYPVDSSFCVPSSSFRRAEALAKHEGVKALSMPKESRSALTECHVLFTGTFVNDKEELKELVEKQGGSVHARGQVI